MRAIRLYGTTDGSGNLTVTSTESAVNGLLYAVQLIDGALADGVDITLTSELPDISIPLLVKENFNTDQMVYPRVLKNLNTDGSTITGQYDIPVIMGQPKMVIASGGATVAGGCVLYVMEDD